MIVEIDGEQLRVYRILEHDDGSVFVYTEDSAWYGIRRVYPGRQEMRIVAAGDGAPPEASRV